MLFIMFKYIVPSKEDWDGNSVTELLKELPCYTMSNSLLRTPDGKLADSAFEKRLWDYGIEDTTQTLNTPLEENRNIGH